MTKRIKIFSRLAVTVFLALALCVSSFFNVRKAEAIAPAVPAAAAAVTALAAELGISEAALMAGVIGITAVGTGVYLLDSGNQTDFISQGEYDRLWNGDLGTGYPENWSDGYQNWRNVANGGKTLGDLTPEERAEYDSPADYVNSGLVSLGVLFPDLFQINNNGDMEPTPEPDPQQDPQGHAKWVKARNVLIALAAGTGGVALSDAVGILADNAAGGIKELLFGKQYLDLEYLNNLVVDGISVPMVYSSLPVTGSSCWYYMTKELTGTIPTTKFFIDDSSLISSFNNTPYNINSVTLQKSGSYYYIYGGGYRAAEWFNAGTQNQWYTGQTTIAQSAYVPTNDPSRYNYALNAAWRGSYVFPSGTYSNGEVTGNAVSTPEYGQLIDTPPDLETSVINNNNWNNYINNFTDAGNDESRTVTIPSFGDGSTHPQYYDFIDITPDSEVVPVPDDVVNPSPNPDPNPNPNPGTQYQQDFGERVTQLLAQPFNQLFPFCLIGDLQQLLNMLHEAAYGEGDGADINGKSTLTIPLSDFNVEGANEIVFDFSVISSLGMFVRPLITALFVVGLLVGSYRFFLTRGGE